MQITFLSYFLAAIVSYLGLLVGTLLVKMAPEEQNPGRKYFIFLKMFFFFLIIALMLFYYANIIFSIAILALLFVLIINKKLNLEKSYLVYFFFGFVFYFSSKIFDLFIIESVLIFLYGIPASSLMIKPRKSNYKEIFIKNLWFFLPVIALYFL